MRCSWAACDRNAIAFEGGWPMCRPHLLEHRRFDAAENKRDCVICFLPFTATNRKRIRCDRCIGKDIPGERAAS